VTRLDATVESIARFAVRRPWLVLAVTLALSLAGLALGAARIELYTSNLDLVDSDLPEVRRFLDFASEFGTPNLLVVVLEGRDERALGTAIDRLGGPLREAPGVKAVVDRLDLDTETLDELGLDPLILSFDHRMAFVFVQPDDARSRAQTIAPMVEGVRQAIALARLGDLGVEAGLTGLPVYALDDRNVIQRDVSRLSILGLVLVAAVFVLGFRELGRPLAAVAAMLAGSAVAVGAIAVVPGHLTLLSAFFASILFGLGIDYGIHAVERVEELVVDGHAEDEAIALAMRSVASGITTAAASAAAAFYAMRWSGFRGFAELGVISGNGILLCWAATVVVLPAALAAWSRLRPAARPGGLAALRARFDRAFRVERRWLALARHPALAAVLAAGALFGAVAHARFDSDYLDLQPRDSETVRLEREMVERSDLSPQFGVFVTDSRERVRELHDALLDADGVGEVRSIADLDEAAEDGEPIEVPADYRALLESAAGRYAVYAYPESDVWSDAAGRAFQDTLRALDPDVTGMPFLGSFMIRLSQRALAITAGLGTVLLIVCVLADFRRPLPALLAATPAFLSVAAMNGLMAALGIHWNPLNVMALPVVLGIAVDDGVHMTHRFLEERGDLARALHGTGRAILLTALTDVAAFGSLAFTAHRGLASFAIALTLGVSASLVLSLLLMPRLLMAASRRLLGDHARAAIRAG
jgi:predicted RND superfamily exporter protein